MKKFLSLVLALVMTMSLVTISAGAKDFTDASKVNYNEAVDVLSAIKVIDGDTTGAFNPQGGLTRGAAAKIICNMILGPTTASALHADTAPFKDVPADSTYAGYIAYCVQQGITSGYTDGTYRPAAPLTGYAFMKMLLGALGYDKAVEGYDGANWSINVAKRALNIGLNKGLVDDFNGAKAVTREEACLYAFNAMQADMVEYDTTITIGDVTVAGSKAAVVENNSNTDGNIARDGEMQFAEKYFTNLKGVADRDDFYRPATTWKIKNETIGTYAETPDLTYTTKVKNGEIYSDLGSKVAAANVDVYVNGEEKASDSVAIAKGGKVVVSESGNGVQTEVYYDADNESAEIILVHTYAGTVDKTVKATATKDAYIVVADINGTAPAANLTFETDETYADDTVVLYTYSELAKEVKTVAEAEMVSGVVTEAQNTVTDGVASQNLTMDGEKYSAAYQFAGVEVGSVTIKEEYNVYLDAYGYMIVVEKIADLSSDYALVLNTRNDGSSWQVGGVFGTDTQARLAFADGTTAVVNTAKKYNGVIANGTIVTYRVDDDGVYTLRPVTTTTPVTSNNFNLTNGKAEIALNSAVSVYANSKTVVVIYNDDDDAWESYTGIKNVPTTKGVGYNVTSYTYVKNGMAQIMFVIPTDYSAQVETSADKLMFVHKDSVSNLINDADGSYYQYDVIVDGEIKTIKVDSSEGKTLNGFYGSYTIDKYDIYDDMAAQSADANGDVNGDYTYFAATGVSKTSEEYTVTFGANTYTVDEDADFYYVDEDEDIYVSSYGAVAKDDNDVAYVIVKDNMVQTMIIVAVEDSDVVVTPTNYELWDNNRGAEATAVTVSIAGGTIGFSEALMLVDTAVPTTVATKNVQVTYEVSTWNTTTNAWNAAQVVESAVTTNAAANFDISTATGSIALPSGIQCMVDVTVTCAAGTFTYPTVVVTSA